MLQRSGMIVLFFLAAMGVLAQGTCDVRVFWDESPASDFKEFRVFRKLDGREPVFYQIARTSETQHVDTVTTAGLWRYGVTVTDHAGNESAMIQTRVQITLAMLDRQAPPPVTGIGIEVLAGRYKSAAVDEQKETVRLVAPYAESLIFDIPESGTPVELMHSAYKGDTVRLRDGSVVVVKQGCEGDSNGTIFMCAVEGCGCISMQVADATTGEERQIYQTDITEIIERGEYFKVQEKKVMDALAEDIKWFEERWK